MRQINLSLVAGLLAFSAFSSVAAEPTTPKKAQSDDTATFQALLWTEEEFDEFTVIDANDDGYTWTYYDDEATARLRSNPDKETPKDDWLITPGIELVGGNQYRITLDMRARKSEYPETFEMMMGNSATVEAMTTTVIGPTNVVNTEGISYRLIITIEESGTYYFGIHAISEPAMSYIYFDYMAVSAPVDLNAPAAVSDIQLTPGEDGEPSMRIQYTAPTLSVGGEELTENMSIDILRDNSLIRTVSNVAPGETKVYNDYFDDYYEYNDSDPVGYFTWSIIPSNSAGVGNSNSAKAYVGINKPSAPQNVVAVETENEGEVTITWEAPTTDVDGYPLNPDNVTYAIYENITGEYIVDGVDDLTYTYQAVGEDENQDFRLYTIIPYTEGGKGTSASGPMIAVGPAYTLPYHESLADGHVETLLGIVTKAGSPEWYLLNDGELSLYSQDDDNGFIAMYGAEIGTCGELNTGKITLADSQHPVLSFYTYAIAETNKNEIDVYVYCEGEESLVKANVIADCIDDDVEWVKISADLTPFAGKTIELGLRCTLKSYTLVVLDNISIEEGIATDLAITNFSVPEQVTSGEEFEILVDVENKGVETASAYTLVLYRDGVEFATAQPVEIPFEDSYQFTFTDKFNVTEADFHNYNAEITIEGDANDEDNFTAEVTATLRGLDLPTVQNVIIVLDETQTYLTWSSPETELEVLGYNIYVDHDVLASTTECEYTGEPISADANQFGVSSLYSEGESRTVTPQTSSAEAIRIRKTTVRAIDSTIQICGDGAQEIAISDIAGRSYYNGVANLPFTMPVAPGIYVVTFGNTHVKITVK